MIGLDTNVLARYLTQDDPRQSLAASRLIESLSEDEPGFVTTVVLVELACVLRAAYSVAPAQISRIVAGLLDSAELVLEDSDAVRRALPAVAAGYDLADVLIAEAGGRAGCSVTVTFDRRAAKLAGMRLLAVR